MPRGTARRRYEQRIAEHLAGRAARRRAAGAGGRARRGSTATSATSPTSRWPAARPACSPASRRSGSRGSPRSSPSGASSPSSTPASGSSTWASSSRVEGIEGDAQTISAARDALAEGAARLVDELRLSLEYYAAQEGAVPIEGIVACGPGTTIPGLTERLQRDLGQRFEIGRPRALAHLDEADGGSFDPFLRPGPGGVARASGQPDPPRGAPWREGADAHRRPRLRDRRGARRRPCSGSPASCSRATRSPTARPRSPSLESAGRGGRGPGRARAAPSPTSPPSSRPGSRRSTSLAQSRFDWERVLRELAIVIPEDVWLTNLTATVSPEVQLDDSGSSSSSELRRRGLGQRRRARRSRSRAAAAVTRPWPGFSPRSGTSTASLASRC